MKFLGILEFLNLKIPRFRISRNSRIPKSRILKSRIPRNSRILDLEFLNLEFLGILNFSFKRIKNELFLQKKVFA